MQLYFSRLRSFFNSMNSSNSTKHKEEILDSYRDDDFIKKCLVYTYHPYKKYGITSANLKKRSDLISPESKYSNLFDLLDDLNSRIITGNSAICEMNAFIKQNEEWADLIYQIIDRNLETRATTTLINNVIPGLIPTFDVALAYDYTKVKDINLSDGTWYISRKLDGVRCITIIQDGEIRFFSRNGKEFFTLDAVKMQIEALGLNNIVLDGEICLMKPDGSDDFQGIVQQISRKNHTINSPKYWVFDVLTLEEFYSGKGDEPFYERLKRLIFTGNIIVNLPQHLIYSEKELADYKKLSEENDWEGLMARKNVCYEGERTKNLIKLKKFLDDEFRVINLIMEKQRIIVDGREVEEEVLSAVEVEYMGGSVRVGSGFDIKERRYFFKNPEKILGKTIKVQFFEHTVDKHGEHSLRFPVFKGVYGDSREI